MFDPVRERIRRGKGRIRKAGCGYLAYALIDAIVDHYFAVLEAVGQKIETIEELVMEDPEPEVLEDIHELKREMIYFRKQVWPVRELLNGLTKSDSTLLQESNRIFFDDVYDHTIQVIDTIESFRDVLSSMLDLYLSTISNRMNEVMKLLTIIATIFIPLTFVAGIYGMGGDAGDHGGHDHLFQTEKVAVAAAGKAGAAQPLKCHASGLLLVAISKFHEGVQGRFFSLCCRPGPCRPHDGSKRHR